MMECRASDLDVAYKGKQITGNALLGFDHQGTLTQVAAHDDPGIYYFSNLITDWFPALDIHTAFYCFITFFSMIAVLSLISLLSLSQHRKFLLFSLVVVTLSIIRIGKATANPDVYILQLLIPAILLPLLFRLWQTLHSKRQQILYGLFFGLIMTVAWSCRSNAVIPWIGLSMVLPFFSLYRKHFGLCLLTMALSFSGGIQYIKHVIAERDTEYVLLSHKTPYLATHPFWHPLLLGLGYFPDNPWGIVALDQYSNDFVHKIDPSITVHSPQSETILKKAYWDIVRNNPIEVFKIYCRKLLITVTGRLSIFLLLAVYLSSLVWLPKRTEGVILLIPIALSLVPSILVFPCREYTVDLPLWVFLAFWWRMRLLVKKEFLWKKQPLF